MTLAACALLFFFTDTAPTEIYTLSLHDALPILTRNSFLDEIRKQYVLTAQAKGLGQRQVLYRSEEHTSELQSQFHLVCRLLLEKKNRTLPRKRRAHTAHI